MSPAGPLLRRAPRALAIFALQGLLWIAVALAFATLVQVAGWARWNDALYFSATNWLPWMVIAPVVFWLARRFPFERAHLLRSVPVHLFACGACIVLLIWLSALFSPFRWPPPSSRTSPGSEARAAEARRSRERPPATTTAGESRAGEPEALAADEQGGPPPVAITDPAVEPVEPRATAAVTAGATAAAPAASGSRGTADRRERWTATRGTSGERKDAGRAPSTGERKEMSRRPGPPPGAFSRPPSGGSRPPGSSMRASTSPSSPPSVLRRWAFVGSFWPPFGGALLRANFAVAVYLIIACVAHAMGYYRRAQQRESQALALAAGLNQAKLDALRLQLQPHFLFNTLNAISALVHRNPQAADELIADLSELLRLSLQAADNEVPLSRELELLDCYLAIERTRLGDRLRIERDIDPAVLTALVPTFILQPLAENAVRHGLEPRRAPGTLSISARRSGAELVLCVADDGVGLPDNAAVPHRGIGLANAEERLRTLHGDLGRLNLTTPPGGGVQVEITLPIRTARPAPAAASPA